MNDDLDTLICPISGKELHLYEIDQFPLFYKRVRTGVLYCPDTGIYYPIINGVPIMLTFRTPLTSAFDKKHHKEISNVVGNLSLPDLKPMPGEKSVQKTFTEEWEGLGDDEIVFMYDQQQGLDLHKSVWLSSIDNEACSNKRAVIDVGCGAGREAEYLSKIFSNAKVFAVDLNLSILANSERLIKSEKVVPVICSLFKLPFPKHQFDHVHCQGVLHHTYDTYEAFTKVENMVSKENGTYFVWVYAWEDSFGVKGFRGAFTHLYYFISHRIFRPILSRLPSHPRTLLVYLISVFYHPLVKYMGNNSHENWKLANTVHAVRDMFTPRYAHRHRHNEVFYWFEEFSYRKIFMQSAKRYCDLFNRRIVGIGFCGHR